MTLKSKEHYEVIEMFKKTFGYGYRLDMEPKEFWSKGAVFQDGELNKLFLAYRSGVAYGKAAA